LNKKLIKLNAVSSNPDQDMKTLKLAIKAGFTVLIENVQETINVALEPLLSKQIVKKGKFFELFIDNETIDFNPEFNLYMTSTLPRPH